MEKVLAIDDKKDNLIVLEAYLKQYLPSLQLIEAQSGIEGIQKAITEQPDVIILDISMPEMDGYAVCQKLKKNKNTLHIPIMLLTAIYTDLKDKVKGLETGADSFLSKPFQPAELISQIKVMLRTKRAEDLLRKEKDMLEKMVQKRTRALENAQHAAILTIARIMEIKDPYASGKHYQIAELSKAIGGHLGLSKEELEGLWFASLICNIGKLTIPADILNKPGKLTEVEYSFIKGHPLSAYKMLSDLPYPWPIAKIILQHHENIDGTGYPKGLKGEDISLEARILRVTDTVIAMLSHRAYRASYNLEEVLKELQENANTYYDEDVVRICVEILKDKGLPASLTTFTKDFTNFYDLK